MQSVETKQSLKQMFGVRSETPIPPVVEPSVSFAGTNPMDVQADMTPAQPYTKSQMGFQRLLIPELKDRSRLGEGWKRAGFNFTILVGATAADLAEGNIVDALFRNRLEKNTDDKIKAAWEAKTDLEKAQGPKPRNKANKTKLDELEKKAKELKEVALKQQGWQAATEFAEEWFSDSAYASLANAWVQLMTGVKGAKYVSETSAFVADWVNIISQVFLSDKFIPGKYHKVSPKTDWGTQHNEVTKKFGINLAYRTMDFVNPVNVEALFRLLEEIPVVGDGVAWAHEKTDKLLESTLGRWGSGIAGKGILGYHIGRNVKPI